MILTSLMEVKKILEIPAAHTTEDAKLLFFMEWASQLILEYLNRPDLELKARTEYYAGTNTQKLPLRHRPVFTTPTIAVRVDEQGFFGTAPDSFGTDTALVYGEDFSLLIDQPDGSSRSGILVRINDVWPQPNARTTGLLSPFVNDSYGPIRVIYTAGYTVDNLPAQIRMACNFLVARMRYIMPVGMETGSESYEDRSLSVLGERRDYLMAIAKPMLVSFRNWSFG